ncbi:MAG: flagellar hook capping FlgD N-terminal domain-containing protein [Paracoccus sp. (in: a-proteobacteria)]|nr:flagellar hook capping FlgD N-terminal domain-containing protein [Paracoccus sp. (in: a-proteobacteria)]
MVTGPATVSTHTQSTGTSQNQAQGKSGFAGGDFETFLKMLTAQIQHQDPLNPIEGADFAVQLATFSGVEQQAQTNALLKQLINAQGGQSLSSYASWIGKQVRTTGQVYFGENPVTMDIAPDSRADKVLLVTMDVYGRRISSENIGTGSGLVDWYGQDAQGERLPKGKYSFVLESYRDDTLISSEKVAAYSDVYEVQQKNGKILLMLSGGITASPDEVDALAIGV